MFVSREYRKSRIPCIQLLESCPYRSRDGPQSTVFFKFFQKLQLELHLQHSVLYQVTLAFVMWHPAEVSHRPVSPSGVSFKEYWKQEPQSQLHQYKPSCRPSYEDQLAISEIQHHSSSCSGSLPPFPQCVPFTSGGNIRDLYKRQFSNPTLLKLG